MKSAPSIAAAPNTPADRSGALCAQHGGNRVSDDKASTTKRQAEKQTRGKHSSQQANSGQPEGMNAQGTESNAEQDT